MKRRTALIRVSTLIAAAIALAALALWRTWSAIGQPVAAERAAYIAPSGPTLPELWESPVFTLPNHLGVSTSNTSLEGSVWIADFIFTTCTAVCPRITASMVRLQNRLLDSRLRFVSFSVDPEHDTIPALAAYKHSWNPGDARWQLLRPTNAGLTQISDAMRVALEPSGNVANPILHTSLFFLVDAAGKVRGVYDSADDRAQQRLLDDTEYLLGTLPAGVANSGTQVRGPLAGAGSDSPSVDPNSGQGLYLKLGCRACHERPELAPSLSGLKDRTTVLAGGEHVLADRAYIERSLLEPAGQMVQGYLELMPSYRGELQGESLNRLVDYLLRGVEPTLPAPSASPASGLAGSTTAPTDSTTTPAGAALRPKLAASTVSPKAPALEVDPVCHMDVRVTPTTPEASYKGKTYHFCSLGCRERFVSEPPKYLP